MLFYVILYAMSYYAMLCNALLCHVMLCYVTLCYVMLCYVMLCYVLYIVLCRVMLCCANSGGDLAPSLGDGKLFRGQTFVNEVFSEKISIFTPKISDDHFFSHRPGFSDFPFLYCMSYITL